jgi:triacylglycerol lipase
MMMQTIDRGLVTLLGNCIIQAYEQFETGGDFEIPAGFRLVTEVTGQSELFPALMGYIIESDSRVILVFRGTRTVGEWLKDLAIRQTEYPYYLAGKTHSGFTELYETVRDTILAALRLLPRWKQLLVTGHSLGAALATLAALDLAVHAGFLNLAMVNFGSPRVGDSQFATAYDGIVGASWRMANLFDPVIHVPPERAKLPFSQETVEYQHVQQEVLLWLPTKNVLQNHDMQTYLSAFRQDDAAQPAG